ncbi:MAG: (d)CMP kinase [Leptospiraceae bacterium]|nr:(d)CMP kinase [Leptospiraceae bacterium]
MIENIIAIDGPAGSGKSSVAREISEKIGYSYLDSGAYYRAVTLFFMRIFRQEKKNENFSDWIMKQGVAKYLDQVTVECILSNNGENTVILNGENVSREIRSPDVTNEIKYLAPVKEVRDFVNQRIRRLAQNHLLILDGRDIGTEVFPESRFKFFLTASADVRAERRYRELQEKGFQPDFESLKKEIVHRDKTDSERKIAPLRQANDAFLIDTSGLSKDVVIRTIISELRSRGLTPKK